MLKADVHGVLDLLEDPADLCNQAIRDMEMEIEGERERNLQLKVRQQQVQQQKEQLEQRMCDLNGQIQACLCPTTRELAKDLVRKRIEYQRRLEILIRRSKEDDAESARSEQRLKGFEERLAAVREKLELFVERWSYRESRQRSNSEVTEAWVSDAEVEAALRQYEAQALEGKQG
jgi:phage shock protein A